MAELATIAAIASIASTAGAAGAAVKQGNTQKAMADYQAEQMKRKAAEEHAAGQRSAIERRDQAGMVQSRQIALAAASGAGTANPTVLDLVEEAAGRGEYFAQGELYQAKSAAAGLRDNAKATAYGGKAAQDAGYMSGFADLLGGVSKTAGYASSAGFLDDPRKKIGPWGTTISYG